MAHESVGGITKRLINLGTIPMSISGKVPELLLVNSGQRFPYWVVVSLNSHTVNTNKLAMSQHSTHFMSRPSML